MSIAQRYRSVRKMTDKLCEPLSPEDCVVQSMPDASPAKWHLAHTSWFFETFVLVPHAPDYRVFHPQFNYLFNSYYNAVGKRHPRPQRGLLTRPSQTDVIRYRAHIDDAMSGLLESSSGELPTRLANIIEIGLNHEQQHQELMLTDLKHLFSLNPIFPAYHTDESGSTAETTPMEWIEFPGGISQIGHQESTFCFDNELPVHEQLLQPFRLGSRLVTNGEFRQFIADDGYQRPELWLSDGWDTVCKHEWRAPLYWQTQDHDRSAALFTLSGLRTLADAEPVCHVSFYEADAYARWAKARLPTEAEWETAAQQQQSHAGNFLEDEHLHPIASSARPESLSQMFGDVWEWTASAYLAYPGYRPFPDGLGEYNGKFMCNQFVLRGGSCATPQSHIRATYRNFFPPTARWQFMGFRIANDVDTARGGR